MPHNDVKSALSVPGGPLTSLLDHVIMLQGIWYGQQRRACALHLVQLSCSSRTAQRSPARLLDLRVPLLGIGEGEQLGSQAERQPPALATGPAAVCSLPGPAAAGLLLGNPPPQGASHGRLGPKGPLLPPLDCYVVQRGAIATLSLQQRGPELLAGDLLPVPG